MSGGVDSSVSAYLLQQQGFEVEGVSFMLGEARGREDHRGCCSLQSARSAAQTASTLGMAHFSVDARLEFIEKVIEPFSESYAKGMTPNPCILCNKYIKFPFLLDEARKRGAGYIATGHYARLQRDETGSGEVFLKKAADLKKDQSYVLYVLREEEIRSLVLPLGEYEKPRVREIARSLGLDAADRPESQEICFVEDDDYCGFLERTEPSLCRPGPIKDLSGKELGSHKGIHRYTVGQRKGLGIASPSPYYVAKIDPVTRTVYVGSQDDAKCREVVVSDLNWLIPPKADTFRAGVKVRSMMKDVPATLTIIADAVRVLFDEPQWAPAPGQSAVFYDGGIVLGGGIIQP
ncbi:MAG: tRNA 2-thiouridine(34) synthase MnmA [Nitrospirae bacterium]|nr:tRNA 2-thiouridine(34) synthase MnmA [Nitrospirota bacterium]